MPRRSPYLRARWALPLCWLATAGQTAWAVDAAVDTTPVVQTSQTSALPEGWQHGAFMEIFVRAFKDSDGDGIGDLKGLTQQLDHLQDLGIRGIWLMPITGNADGDHGYATTNFRNIAPEYGTLADFDELIRQAHRRGIGVVMDYVINHSAASHPLFVQARRGPDAPFRDWYVFNKTAPAGWDIWGKYPWYHVAAQPWTWHGEVKDMPLAAAGAQDFYFGTFGPHMPDFNFKNPEVLAFHESSLRFWLNRGLDGYRLDAVPHLIENNAVDWNNQPQSRMLTKRLQDLIKAYPRRYVVCEATAEPQQYGDAAVCGGAFAFGYVHHFVEAARGKAESVNKVANFYLKASPNMATFVSNHDIFAGQRLWDQVQGDEARYKLAAAAYLLQPGTPFVYFGEEIGQAGVPDLPGDQPLRSPMSWSATTAGFSAGQPFRPGSPNSAHYNVQVQRADPASIYHFYKAMIGLRNRWPSIARGSYEAAFAQGLVAGWQRRLGQEHTLVLINYDTSGQQVQVPQVPRGARLLPLWPEDAVPARARSAALGQGEVSVYLPPQSLRVYQVRR